MKNESEIALGGEETARIIELATYKVLQELKNILGKDTSISIMNEILSPISIFLLSKFIGTEKKEGIVHEESGNYGQKIIVEQYRNWLEENKEDLKDMTDMLNKYEK